MDQYFVVKYSGPFGFIKPWTAVRDGETYSQQFLTPSIIEGIEKKLFPELLATKGLQGKIVGHRLSYIGLSQQQEQTWSKAWVTKNAGTLTEKILVVPKKKKSEDAEPTYKEIKTKLINSKPATGILNRNVLIEPWLYLAFSSELDAQRASEQHICLCRNEDLLLPDEEIMQMDSDGWNLVEGFELIFSQKNESVFRVGYNRFQDSLPMYGRLVSVGDPIRKLDS